MRTNEIEKSALAHGFLLLPQKRPRPEPQPAEALEEVAEEDMAAALQLLQAETAHVRRAMGHEKVWMLPKPIAISVQLIRSQ